MIKILLFSGASLKTRTVCLITRMSSLRMTTMRIMKSSKTNRWICVGLITKNNSWMREIQNVWIRFRHHSIFLKWLKYLRILYQIFRICLLLQETFMRQKELWKWTQMIWWHKYIKIRLKMAIFRISPPLVTVISPIYNKIFCSTRINCSIGRHIKSTT